MRNLLLVGLGGGIGSMLRYACQRWLSVYSNTLGFPFGTLTVNVIGSFVIGLLFGFSLKSQQEHSVNLFLMAGLCGGFTTFSAFTLEGNELLKQDKPGLFFLYIGGSVILGLAATWLGLKLTR